EGTQVVVTVDGMTRKLRPPEAARLQADLARALHLVLEERVRVVSGLLVTPDNADWDHVISGLDLGNVETSSKQPCVHSPADSIGSQRPHEGSPNCPGSSDQL